MTDRIKAIRERAEKATPGPWEHLNIGEVAAHVGTLKAFVIARCPGRDLKDAPIRGANGEFIAAAREDVPYLLDRIAELEAEVERLKTALACIEAVVRPMAPLFDEVRRLQDVTKGGDV